jgi:hypothetical protein
VTKPVAPAEAGEDAPDAVVFEGAEATVFVDALNAGTASAAYLREADEVFARLYTSEPANSLFRLEESR